MNIEKIQKRLNSLDADNPGVQHSLEAYIFTDHVEFAVSTKEELTDGSGSLEGVGEQFDTEDELREWA